MMGMLRAMMWMLRAVMGMLRAMNVAAAPLFFFLRAPFDLRRDECLASASAPAPPSTPAPADETGPGGTPSSSYPLSSPPAGRHPSAFSPPPGGYARRIGPGPAPTFGPPPGRYA
eukprot:1175562-Prorocentrum_minimum.AAC.5